MPANVEVIGRVFQGVATAGQVVFSAATSWFAVPFTVPAGDYYMTIAPETTGGTIRWSYSNIGTPGTTNGLLAPTYLAIKLTKSQVIYYGSSTASDSVNYTIKEI